MGIDLARAALDAGHRVVATARDAAKVTAALGEHDNLLAVSLDVTDPAAAQAAVDAAVERFGRIDMLVNNAGNFYAGYFEEISDAQFRAQMETNFFGPLNVTRAVLPVMRAQRSGQVVTITSTAGIVGREFCAAYAASKFALEGWMESLRFDVEPRSASPPPSSSPASSAPSCSSRAPRRSGRSSRSTTTPTAPQQTIEAWKAHERPAGRRPRQARPRSGAADGPRRAAAALGRRRRRRSRRRAESRTTSSPRPTPTASFPRTSTTTTPDPLPKQPTHSRRTPT